MAIVNTIKEVLHHIRIKLYHNYLPNVEGAYIARTDNEASLGIEHICAALKNRGGFSGNYEDLVENVRQFFYEAAYQLCDGFAVSTGYYSIHPNVGGTFNNVAEIHNHKKHPGQRSAGKNDRTFRRKHLVKSHRHSPGACFSPLVQSGHCTPIFIRQHPPKRTENHNKRI